MSYRRSRRHDGRVHACFFTRPVSRAAARSAWASTAADASPLTSPRRSTTSATAAASPHSPRASAKRMRLVPGDTRFAPSAMLRTVAPAARGSRSEHAYAYACAHEHAYETKIAKASPNVGVDDAYGQPGFEADLAGGGGGNQQGVAGRREGQAPGIGAGGSGWGGGDSEKRFDGGEFIFGSSQTKR